MPKLLMGAALAALSLIATSAARASGLVEGGPAAATAITPLGEVLLNAKRPVHIVFVHGMRATGSGGSLAARSSAAVFQSSAKLALSRRGPGSLCPSNPSRKRR